ncbi:GNAT family N-acetyltransferase [Mesorhizobium sp. B3-1-3]|uniref:GNAT family N-acetyltransferase n=1 Tax=unclassified Mesorhizobium TaxID=325217 RepID=UPI00112E0BD5|nr:MULTISPECIES: GNAT family N-acetyltransferase [unclassified Mesorhizobium]TPI61470.1 GNAT family N-acetyltransferase [Mesorhizobium sp. B3-1-8]TPI70579.1 GNAT family N-acetyltransferase [Mesorhizobium sp. B3-1-3]
MKSGELPGPGAEPPVPPVEIRVLHRTEHLVTAAHVFRAAMVGLPALHTIDDTVLKRLFEPARAFGAFDRGNLVGTTNSHASSIRVPGGHWVRQAAVTHVGVLPSHRRRGIAKALLVAQLRAARQAGEPIATLRATEGHIYGNFGYGIANRVMDVELDRSTAKLRPGLDRAQIVCVEPVDACWARLRKIFENHLAPRVAAVSRGDIWWCATLARMAHGPTRAYAAICGDAGGDTGYVRYHAASGGDWFESRNRAVIVDDLVAHDAQAYVALIGYLLDLDIAHRIALSTRPLDDVLPFLLEDSRSVRVSAVRDETWLRLVDAEAAFAASTFEDRAGVEPIVLEIVDRLLPENAVKLRFASGHVERVNCRADVIADISSASAAFLGGTRWWQLAESGRLQISDRLGVVRLDRLQDNLVSPFGGTSF